MNTKHTPGPWAVYYQNGDKPYIVAEQGKNLDNPIICEMCLDVPPQIIGGVAIEDANARLVASSPDLLEALDRILKAANASDSNEPLLGWVADTASAAIAKATGETE